MPARGSCCRESSVISTIACECGDHDGRALAIADSTRALKLKLSPIQALKYQSRRVANASSQWDKYHLAYLSTIRATARVRATAA